MARGWVRELGKPSPAPVTADREQPVRITVQTGSRTGPEGWRMGSWYQRRPGTTQPGYQGRTPATSRACRGRDRSVNAPVANDTHDTTRELQLKLYRAAKRSPARRFHALYDKVYRRDILERAWEEVRRNRGAPGVDGVTIAQVERQGVEGFLDELAVQLQDGTYRPLPVRRVTIPKPQGGERNLGVPAVRDRVVQAAAKAVLEPIFEADFLDCSFGFRPGRSAHQALEAIRVEVNRGRCWVVDADIASFFDSIRPEVLGAALAERVSDRRMRKLIMGWLKAGVLAGETLLHPQAGTPQGGVASPLLANVVLHRLDRAWQARHRRLGVLVRYCDDLVILCPTRERAEAALAALTGLLADLGRFVTDRMARFIANKHGYRGRNYGLLVLMGNGYLGLQRLVGSVRYGAVHAAR